MKERKDRVDDALHATRAAVEEGIVPGGGVALARASTVLAKLNAENDDQRVGIEIVRKAVQMPLRQIAENAGEDGAVIRVDPRQVPGQLGFDADGEFKDLVKAGIIDPTKVVRSALQNAASVGSLMVTTEAMVAERPEKRAASGGPPGGGMGGMGGMGDGLLRWSSRTHLIRRSTQRLPGCCGAKHCAVRPRSEHNVGTWARRCTGADIGRSHGRGSARIPDPKRRRDSREHT